MAKYENEGYCPNNYVADWLIKENSSLFGLWNIIGNSIVYEDKSSIINIEQFNKIFTEDVISTDLITSIIKKKPTAEKILVRQFCNLSCCTQKISDIQKVMKQAIDPELVLHAGSDFAAILADSDYGMDIWVWDLNNCF